MTIAKLIMAKNFYLERVVIIYIILDFDEYKSLKRAATLSEFKPKMSYDPQNRRNKELYGNEIARDHLPTKEVNLEQQSP